MSDKPYKIGDDVEVLYLSNKWIASVVVGIETVTEETAKQVRGAYPGIEVGEPLLKCTEKGYGNVRSFLPNQGRVRRPALI